jgi:pantothenate kinase
LSQNTWQRYHHLIDKREAETLTASEQTELITISDQIEMANARRMESLVKLAQLRQTSLEELMSRLGLMGQQYV